MSNRGKSVAFRLYHTVQSAEDFASELSCGSDGSRSKSLVLQMKLGAETSTCNRFSRESIPEAMLCEPVLESITCLNMERQRS